MDHVFYYDDDDFGAYGVDCGILNDGFDLVDGYPFYCVVRRAKNLYVVCDAVALILY